MSGAVAHPSWLRRHGGKVAASLVVAGCFGWLLHRGALPLAPAASSFSRVRWWTVPAYVAIWCCIHSIRAGRWSLLLRPIAPVSLRRVFAASFIGFAAIALVPLRAGEAVRPLLIRGGKLSGWAATGTIAAERIIDGLTLSTMLLLGLWFSTPLSPLPDHIGNLSVSPAVVPRVAHYALALFGAAFSVMGIFYVKRDWARRTTEQIIGVVSPRLATWLADRVENVAAGLQFLPNLRVTIPFVAATALYWALNSAGLWLLAWGVGFDEFTFAQACVTTGVIALGILVPNAPGFFGAYQLAFYAALAVFYPLDLVTGPGAACVLIIYTAQMLMTILAAVLGMFLEKTSFKDAFAPEGASLEGT